MDIVQSLNEQSKVINIINSIEKEVSSLCEGFIGQPVNDQNTILIEQRVQEMLFAHELNIPSEFIEITINT